MLSSVRVRLPLPGPLVKWLRHRPFTAVTWVRVPYGSPKKANPNQLCGAGSDLFIPGSPRRRSLRTAQKNQSLKTAGFSSAVLRVSSFSPLDPLRGSRGETPFCEYYHVTRTNEETASQRGAVSSLTDESFLRERRFMLNSNKML